MKAFQKAQRLTADGVVGPSTWAALIRGGGAVAGAAILEAAESSGDAQASAKLEGAGISRVSSGNCTARNRKNCTSLQSIRVGTSTASSP
ncbi:peptidoglycan-binding protein [Streptomyces sp. CEV 2-1]|uniref:peptidoglycan-binding domain-containing protein n=1 Tax=Streptomyces sp. CEV 2-1 TaxID=2485153 RepID=UPI0021A73FF0|nr:peptidoglycan-binding domain-containing protein [Streptomyces sp. CEV 2-1]